MATIASKNPATQEIVGEVEVSTSEQIKDTVLKAQQAFKTWKNTSLQERKVILKKVISTIGQHTDELVELITNEIGMPKAYVKEFEIGEAIRYANWYVDNAEKYISSEVVYEDETSKHIVFYEPIGVAAVITPWNYPLTSIIWGSIQNLLVGNAVVFKHSKECIVAAKKIEDIIKTTELPEGVFQEVYGDSEVAQALLQQDINLISFTGSTKVGKEVFRLAGEKFIKALVELGGSAPGIVCEDANLDETLESIYFNRYFHSGQVCDGLKRLIVHESRFDEVVEKLQQLLSKKVVGDPQDKNTEIGPLISEKQLVLLEEQVQDAIDKGAKVIIGGKRVSGMKGNYYEPTILVNVSKNMRVWQEEVFGPVLPIAPFTTEEKAIAMANDNPYGLGGYIFTANKDKALELAKKLDTGMISINNAMYLQPTSPFGGFKNSGIGREHGKFGFHELTQLKVVAVEK